MAKCNRKARRKRAKRNLDRATVLPFGNNDDQEYLILCKGIGWMRMIGKAKATAGPGHRAHLSINGAIIKDEDEAGRAALDAWETNTRGKGDRR